LGEDERIDIEEVDGSGSMSNRLSTGSSVVSVDDGDESKYL
jgi:hypothetical protein